MDKNQCTVQIELTDASPMQKERTASTVVRLQCPHYAPAAPAPRDFQRRLSTLSLPLHSGPPMIWPVLPP